MIKLTVEEQQIVGRALRRSAKLVHPIDPATLALAARVVESRKTDTRSEQQIIEDGVRFVMGPGGDEGTRRRHDLGPA